jgi:hypothetical protein
MLGGLSLYNFSLLFPCMVEKAAVRSTTNMDGEPCWLLPKGSYGERACDAEAKGILACFIVILISGGLTMIFFYERLTLLVVTSGFC